jgi:CheY-like chemotaxis protein
MSPGKNILLVESDPASRADLAVNLGRLGHTVRCAASCAEALEELRTRRPQLIVLDVRTAEQGGRTLCRHKRREPDLADIPLVFVSAPGRSGQANDIPGDVTQFPNPINRDQLLAALGQPVRNGEADAPPSSAAG